MGLREDSIVAREDDTHRGASSRSVSRARSRSALAAFALTIVLVGCGGEPDELPRIARAPVMELDARTPILPIPRDAPVLDAARVRLGRELFFDPILSGDLSVTCSECHDLARAGTDGQRRSHAGARAEGGVNVPTIFNLEWVFRYSWSGRFDRMRDILDVAMTNPATMASTWEGAAERLRRSPRHRVRFEQVYGAPPSEELLRDVIETFVLSLTTPDAPFDRWLRGDEDAISDEARRGYEIFREHGCASCHQGVDVGGNMYQRFGVMRDYFADRGDVRDADLGLFLGTHRESDRHVFRVPSLRNVALTAPYFHDGSAETLEDAIATMARYQLGRKLDGVLIDSIVAFLKSLTGRIDDSRPPAP
ncbi:MAG: c-type cytochrome [Myxococcota bacterium]|nr:c-type cytochrome [Myxococcota bacterium]